MAQALLNNLTNIVRDIYPAGNAQDVPVDANFEQILDSQTIDECSNIEVIEQTAETIVENLASVMSESKLTAAIEMAVDAVTANTEEQVAEEQINEIIGDVLDLEEDSITEENDKQDTTTITQNEDPTMNKQLQATLENPATVIVLQQAQSILKNQNSETVENEAVIPTEKQTVLTDKATAAQAEKFTIVEPEKSTQKESTQNSKTLREIVDEKVLEELNIEAVSSSEEGDAAGNLMQYQTPQEQAVKVMLHEDMKFENIKNIAFKSAEAQPETSSSKIIEQVTKQMEGMYNTSKVNIVLNPASLGKVVLHLVNSKEGLLAHFTVNNADTQNALLKGLAGLKESLLAQGISVDNIVIELNESELGDSEQHPDWTEQENSGKGNRGQGSRKQKQEKKNFEQTMFEINQS